MPFIAAPGNSEAIFTHSMGGFSALHALHINPELLLNRLVLIGLPGEWLDFIGFFKKVVQAVSDYLMEKHSKEHYLISH